MSGTDVVYVCADGENPELRYSLRSLKNVEHRKVFIFGGAPVWADVIHRYRPQESTPYASTRAHIKAACLDPEVSNPFMLWNDDFYAMRRDKNEKHFHRGPLSEMVDAHTHVKTPWANGLRETASFLATVEGISDPVSYDLHLPILVYKADMLEALHIAEQLKSDAVHLRTIYGNLTELGGEQIEDPKLIRRSDPFPKGRWLSSSDDTFRSTVEPVLRYLFPSPCKYEKG